MSVCADDCRCLQGVLPRWDLALQVVVSCPAWELGTELCSSVRAVVMSSDPLGHLSSPIKIFSNCICGLTG